MSRRENCQGGEEGGLDKQRQKTDQRKSGGVAGMFCRKADVCVCVCLRESWSSRLTFDRGDDSSSCTEDIHRVEALVFADDGLQDSQQLPQPLVDGLMEAVLVLCKATKPVLLIHNHLTVIQQTIN